MILSDREIRSRINFPAGDPCRLVIEPFCAAKVKPAGRVSYGLQSFGYDIRLGENFVAYRGGRGYLDPAVPVPTQQTYPGEIWAEHLTGMAEIVLEPHDFLLAEAIEWIEMPTDCTAVVQTKSSLARIGLCLNTTPVEAGWKGRLTLELANLTPHRLKLRAGDGIGQVVFLKGSGPCETPYSGRYQNQEGVTLPRV